MKHIHPHKPTAFIACCSIAVVFFILGAACIGLGLSKKAIALCFIPGFVLAVAPFMINDVSADDITLIKLRIRQYIAAHMPLLKKMTMSFALLVAAVLAFLYDDNVGLAAILSVIACMLPFTQGIKIRWRFLRLKLKRKIFAEKFDGTEKDPENIYEVESVHV